MSEPQRIAIVDDELDIRITRLRKKVETDPSKPQTIKTVRGAGYIFVQK